MELSGFCDFVFSRRVYIQHARDGSKFSTLSGESRELHWNMYYAEPLRGEGRRTR
jgi:hypothetical protein